MWLMLFRPIYSGLRILCATFRAPHPAQPFSTSLVHVRGPKIDDPAWVGSITGDNLGRRVRVRLEAMAVYSVTVAYSGRLQQSNETRQAASRGRKRKIQLPAAWCALPGCITTITGTLQLRLTFRSQPFWVTQFPTLPFALPKGPIRYMTRRFERVGPGDGIYRRPCRWPGLSGVRERCSPACTDGQSEDSAVDPCYSVDPCCSDSVSCSKHHDLRREGSAETRKTKFILSSSAVSKRARWCKRD